MQPWKAFEDWSTAQLVATDGNRNLMARMNPEHLAVDTQSWGSSLNRGVLTRPSGVEFDEAEASVAASGATYCDIVVFKILREQGVITTTNFSTFQSSHLIRHTSYIKEDVLSIQRYVFQQVWWGMWKVETWSRRPRLRQSFENDDKSCMRMSCDAPISAHHISPPIFIIIALNTNDISTCDLYIIVSAFLRAIQRYWPR